MSKIIDPIALRVSTRYFNTEKAIPSDDFLSIIKAGSLAPSGFGSEPWKFIKINNTNKALLDALNNQQHALDASNLVCIAYVKEGYINNNPAFMDRFKSIMGLEKYEMYASRIQAIIKSNYFKEQCMFAASNMCIQATALQIDSLIMGSFNEDDLLSLLKLDPQQYGIALVIAFGYARQEIKPKDKRPLEEIYFEIDI
ncbi:MAG: nitroreductase family protein [Bacilli bacterium]